tara:strand:- start:7266 stop:7511 length:246 start_codon:yes stop_codon:yes gene_type:complete
MKASRKLAKTFVRKGTKRQIAITNDGRTVAWVHIEYKNNGQFLIYDKSAIPTTKYDGKDGGWSNLRNSQIQIYKPKDRSKN